MAVLATAGHVDHGKSALIQALTGRDPDRYAEEKRRGMTLDLGFAWTELPSGKVVAFVDVPGHERFVPTMLAGVGPVPAVIMVVAADEGWQQQSAEHLAAIDALGARHGLLVVTKSDLADPQPVLADARRQLEASSLRGIPSVVASIHDPASVQSLRLALDQVVAELPDPVEAAPLRFWVDRSFTIRGAGTVVTGTLGAGRLNVGDDLLLSEAELPVTVRELQSMDSRIRQAVPVSRVAVNLRGVDKAQVGRGSALVTPQAWTTTSLVDVRCVESDPLTGTTMVHIGSAAVPAHIRRLAGEFYRIRLARTLPLHVGDRLLLRDPARHLILGGVEVVDVSPPSLRHGGSAADRAHALTGPDTVDREIVRRGVVNDAALRAAGYTETPSDARRLGPRWVSTERFLAWQAALQALVTERGEMSVDDARARLDLPDRDLIGELVASSDGLQLRHGYISSATDATPDSAALAALLLRLAVDPLDAPEADALDVDPGDLARATRHGRLLHLGHGVYVGATAPDLAVHLLAGLEQPFTTSAARLALGTTRRVAVPLLEHLDRLRRTRRISATERQVLDTGAQPEPGRS